MIYISRSQYNSFDECNRKRWLMYHAPNGINMFTGKCATCGHLFASNETSPSPVCDACGSTGQIKWQPIVKGWQRRAWAVPLATGAWVHNGIAHIIRGMSPYAAALAASDDYRAKMTERGLDAIGDMTHVIEEQSRLVEALVYTFGIIRWPEISNEFDSVLYDSGNNLVELFVEREGAIQIADNMTFQFRCDWVARRRADGRTFVFNWKTSSYMDERWIKAWEYDAQVLTESWGVQQAFGVKTDGVIVVGLYKGRREKIKDADKKVIGERQVTPLIVGYHRPDNPPLWKEAFTSDGRQAKAKGWYRFAPGGEGMPTVREWIDQLPRDVLEAQFVTVSPVYRDDEQTMKKLVQITTRERRVDEWAAVCTKTPELIDTYFPQNERACLWPTKCPMLDICWTRNVANDIGGSGLYQPRQPNHPVADGGE